jgi:hypothetical protein
MGYTTDFMGSLDINPVLTAKQVEFINRLNRTRRMKRDVNKLMEIYKGEHGNPFATEKTPEAIYGVDGEFFVGDENDRDGSILNYNVSPGQSDFMRKSIAQPGLWCQWEITEDGTELKWDGGDKFYNYVDWLRYLINRFFEPWGNKLNGEIEWVGEDSSDLGMIEVKDNKVKVHRGRVMYDKEEEEEE